MAETLTDDLGKWLAALTTWREQHDPWASCNGCPCGPDHDKLHAELMARKAALLARCATAIAGTGPVPPAEPLPAPGGEGSRPPTAPLTLHHHEEDAAGRVGSLPTGAGFDSPASPSPYELSSAQVVTLASRLEAAAEALRGRSVLADIDRMDLADDLAWFAHELLGTEVHGCRSPPVNPSAAAVAAARHNGLLEGEEALNEDGQACDHHDHFNPAPAVWRASTTFGGGRSPMPGDLGWWCADHLGDGLDEVDGTVILDHVSSL